MRRLSDFFKVIALLCFAAALLLTVFNVQDDRQAEQSSDEALELLLSDLPDVDTTIAETVGDLAPEVIHESVDATEEVIPDFILNPSMSMPVDVVDGYEYIGVLEIDELSLVLPVMGDWNYPSLKISPCRYSGSAYQGNFVIMAHNYSSHFGKLSSLSSSSVVRFTDMDGNVFLYQVSEIEILDPTEVESVISSGWDLTLFTCTIGGRSRVTVRCKQL